VFGWFEEPSNIWDSRDDSRTSVKIIAFVVSLEDDAGAEAGAILTPVVTSFMRARERARLTIAVRTSHLSRPRVEIRGSFHQFRCHLKNPG
jgi:hypothetical protein